MDRALSGWIAECSGAARCKLQTFGTSGVSAEKNRDCPEWHLTCTEQSAIRTDSESSNGLSRIGLKLVWSTICKATEDRTMRSMKLAVVVFLIASCGGAPKLIAKEP